MGFDGQHTGALLQTFGAEVALLSGQPTAVAVGGVISQRVLGISELIFYLISTQLVPLENGIAEEQVIK